MRKKNMYTSAMVESIRNSGMWLKEAKILSRRGSKGHAQALLIFAGEELGKAVYCWFVRIGLIPINHPDVDYIQKDRDGIFRSHALKSATTLGLMLGLQTADSTPDDELNSRVIDPLTNAPSNLQEVLGKMGKFAEWARLRWMYVDIVKDEGKDEKVISPLNIEPESIKGGLKDLERILRIIKEIVRLEALPDEFLEWIESTRGFLKVNDERFPDNPEWD